MVAKTVTVEVEPELMKQIEDLADLFETSKEIGMKLIFLNILSSPDYFPKFERELLERRIEALEKLRKDKISLIDNKIKRLQDGIKPLCVGDKIEKLQETVCPILTNEELK